MVLDYNIRRKKQELVVKINQDLQMKDIEKNTLSTVKEIVIKNFKNGY